MSLGGLVLCGGRSRRFGAEKALAELGGRPLAAIIAEVLGAAGDRVGVSAAEGSGAAGWARSRGFEVIPDGGTPFNGPLFGVLAGLHWAASWGADGLVTAPCDVPLLPADYASRLAAAVVCPLGVVAVDDRSKVQPLCALWPTKARDGLAEALRGDRHAAARDIIKDLGFRQVQFDEPNAFFNVNSPADLDAIRSSRAESS